MEGHCASYIGQLLLLKLRSRVRSGSLVEDIQQETFLRVLRHIRQHGGIEHPERLGAFVNTVCNNVTLEFFRAQGRHPNLSDSTPEPVDHSVDLEGDLADQERKRMVRSVLAELSGKDRTILRMVFLDDIDKDEVCSTMRVNRDYLRVLLFRARTRLKKMVLERTPAKNSGAGSGSE